MNTETDANRCERETYDHNPPPGREAPRDDARAYPTRAPPRASLPAPRLGLPGPDEARSLGRRLDMHGLWRDRHSAGRRTTTPGIGSPDKLISVRGRSSR